MKSIKNYFKSKCKQKITSNDLKGYKSLLKIIYHPNSESPVIDLKRNSVRYFISNPKIKIDLIIDETKAEIINSHRIWPLELNEEVYKRIIKKIKDIKKKQIEEKELSIKNKKQTIFDELYNSI